jgi:hypothetical protein
LLLAAGKKKSALAHEGIIARGKLGDESIRVGFDARFPDKPQPLLWRGISVRGTNKAILDVLADGGGEEYGFLGHKTDL